MRRVHGSVFLSLDGVMQAPGGPTEDPTGGFPFGGWLAGIDDEAVGQSVGAFFDRPYALLLGRRTYAIFAAYWPYIDGAGEDGGMASAFTAADKYVLTRRGTDLGWANSHALGDLDALAEMRAGEGPDLLIQGSSTLYPALLARGMLDRLTLLTFPVVLGRGKTLFGDGTPPGMLRLVEHSVSPGGVVIATYEPAGPVRTGSFGQADNARETERQRRMAEGSW